MEQAVSVWCRRRRGPEDAQRRCDAKSGVGGACPSRLMRFLLCTWRRALLARHAVVATAAALPPPESLHLIEEPMRTAALEAWSAGQRVYACPDLEVAFARPPQQQQQQHRRQQSEDEDEERRAFAAMCAWIHVLRRWTRCGGGGGTQLHVRMIWTDLRKTRRPTDPRGAEQANGGFAFGCGRAELVVYRREEWWKVFLHETLHSLELDSRRRRNAQQKKEEEEPAWFEAFTECWARLWYVAWTAVVRHPRAAARQERAFQQLLAESQMFGWAQAARWNAGEGGDGGGETSDAMMLTAAEFREQTPGRMYFTAATALLCNLGALHRFTAAAHIMRPPKQEEEDGYDRGMDDLAELIRAAVRSPTAARLRREVRLRPPPPLTPPNSMRMTHLDASPEVKMTAAAASTTRRRRPPRGTATQA